MSSTKATPAILTNVGASWLSGFNPIPVATINEFVRQCVECVANTGEFVAATVKVAEGIKGTGLYAGLVLALGALGHGYLTSQATLAQTAQATQAAQAKAAAEQQAAQAQQQQQQLQQIQQQQAAQAAQALQQIQQQMQNTQQLQQQAHQQAPAHAQDPMRPRFQLSEEQEERLQLAGEKRQDGTPQSAASSRDGGGWGGAARPGRWRHRPRITD